MILSFSLILASIILFSLSFCGFGKIFLKSFKIKNQNNFYEEVIYGLYLVSFLALIWNFFSNINVYFSFSIFFIGLLIYLTTGNFKKKFIVDIISVLILSFLSLILISFAKFQEDLPWYTLPYISVLNEDKINFGLTNIQFRFGHTSILSYASAYTSQIFTISNLVIPLIISCVSIFLYFLKECYAKKNELLNLFSFFVATYFLIKINRFEEYGNDIPAFLLYCFIVYQLLSYVLNKEIGNNLIALFFLILILIFQKLTMLPAIFLALVIIFLLRFKLKSLILLFSIGIFCSFFWISKNVINTGCLIYPVNLTCFESLPWTAKKNTHGHAKAISNLSEAWSKGWIDQPSKKKLNYKNYIEGFSWIKIWSIKNPKLIIEKLFPLFILFLLCFIFKKKKRILKKDNRFIKILNCINFINLLSILIWFLNYPIFRYGAVFIIVFFIGIFIKYFYTHDFTIDKKIINFLIILCCTFFISKNILRVYNDYEDYSLAPWPKVYSEVENIPKDYRVINKDFKKTLIFPSDERACYYSFILCSHHVEIEKSIIIDLNSYGYKIIKSN